MRAIRLATAAALAASLVLTFAAWLEPANVLAFVSSLSFCQ
ncbi:MAG: hypothetical protein ACM31P_19245 [Actinomycetota bacterium]